MIAMLVGDDDQAGLVDGRGDVAGGGRIVRLLDATSEEPVDLLVHAGVHHHRAVGIHDLKRRPCLHTRLDGRALHGEVLGAAALGEFQDIDAQRLSSRNEPRHSPGDGDVGAPGGSLGVRT